MTLVAVGAIHLLLGFALLTGLAPGVSTKVEETLRLIDLASPPPPPPPEALAPAAKEQSRKAPAPPAPKADPKPLSAPPVRPPQPVTLTAAPVAGEGSASNAGAALAGSGTGAGGSGTGTGGGGGGIASHAQWLAGAITDRDYPEQAKRAKVQGAVAIVFTVRRTGRISDCRIDRSSGSAELDRLTCLLAEQRLRFAPARDLAGRPVDEVSGRYFRFVLGRRGF